MEKKMDAISAAAFLALALCAHGADFHDWAKTPPMGWNSWDCFGTTLTEAQSREQADMQAKYLLPAGYKYHTVDIQWYEPDSVRHWYKEGAKLEMDGYGRLLPAVKKFPSAAGGKGFRPLADYVHSKGLKFAIHMMRGIPRQAVDQNTPVLGTKFRAKDIANVNDKCAWNPDKYGGDMTKLDKFTLDLLTNTAVVAINQASENNRQLWRKGDHVAWTADVPGSKDKYVAVFNAETEGDVDGRRVPAEAEIAVDLKEIGFTGPVAATELWTGKTLNLSEPVLRQSVKCHDCAVFRISKSKATKGGCP